MFMAELFASTSGTDSDWIVKLIDVYPEDLSRTIQDAMGGYQLMIADEVLRGRFRNSFEKPEPMPAEPGRSIHDRPAHERSRVPEGTPDHGAGAEHLVPAVSTAIRRRLCRTFSRRTREITRKPCSACIEAAAIPAPCCYRW